MSAFKNRFNGSHFLRLAGMGSRYKELFGTSAARVTGNGTTLYLPAHGVMVVR